MAWGHRHSQKDIQNFFEPQGWNDEDNFQGVVFLFNAVDRRRTSKGVGNCTPDLLTIRRG